MDPTGPFLPSRAAASAAGVTAGIAADAPSLARWGDLLYGGQVVPTPLVARETAVAVLVPATAGVRLGTGHDAADLALELHRAVATGRG